MKFDIITFGSAIEDSFLRLENEDYKILEGDLPNDKALCFSLGSKFLIKETETATGGGGTNAAATFARQGFKVAYCGKVGEDERGERIVKEMKKFGVNVSLVMKDKKYPTAYAIVLSSDKERTILVHHGACHYFKKEEIPWEKIKRAKYFYIAPLSGETAGIFPELAEFAKKNKIKVAANLGMSQINLPGEILRSALQKIDILILNKEEAAALSKETEKKEIVKKIYSFTPAVVVITKGKDGSLVFDGKNIFEAEAFKVEVVEKTGAGDAYGAGLVSGILQKNDIEYAIRLATANAAGCIGEKGAKEGLLRKKDLNRLPETEIKKYYL